METAERHACPYWFKRKSREKGKTKRREEWLCESNIPACLVWFGRLWAWNTKYSKRYCITVRSVMGVECGAHSGPGPPTFSSLSLSCCLPTPRNMSSENSSCPQPRPCLHHVTRILPQIQHALPCRVNVLATYSLPTLPELTYCSTQYPSLCRPMHALFS